MGTRERAVEVPQQIGPISFIGPICSRGLERAVISFKLRTSVSERSLANTWKCSSGLWIISHSLPFSARRVERLPVLRAISFRNFRGHAIVNSSQIGVAFLNADFFGAGGVSISVRYY